MEIFIIDGQALYINRLTDGRYRIVNLDTKVQGVMCDTYAEAEATLRAGERP